MGKLKKAMSIILVMLVVFSGITSGSFAGGEEISGEDIEINGPPDLEDLDFTSKRLIVKSFGEMMEGFPVIAELDGIYLLQYETEEETKEAYIYFLEDGESVEIDKAVSIAVGGEEGEPTELMTEEENPFAEAEEIVVEEINYDIAIIDTGARDAEGMVSVLGDDGFDNNGHGQKMIDIVRGFAPAMMEWEIFLPYMLQSSWL